MEIQHIFADEYEYTETVTSVGPTGEIESYFDIVPVEVSMCGLEGYRGNIEFAYPEDKATCQNCIDEYALRLLSELDDD